MKCELSVNIDHVATLRQARGGSEPDPVRAAGQALDAGADGITLHLREDRRHIQDHDLERMRVLCRPGHGHLNLEMALTSEMIGIARAVKPDRATLVPEKRAELTTEGGLEIAGAAAASLREGIARLLEASIPVSLFLDPVEALAAPAKALGATMVEIHTGAYSNAAGDAAERELERIGRAARAFEREGLEVHAGHGLNVANVGPLLKRYPFTELSIGHALVARAVELGLAAAVREMIAAIARS